MTPAGAVHVACAVLALVAAVLVLRRPKGTAQHVRIGRAYIGLLLGLNISALLVPSDGIGPFHVLAVVSLLTLAGGWLASPRRARRREPHAVFMVWSVAGVVAAGLAQAATATATGAAPWPTVLATTVVCAVAGVATLRLVRPRGDAATSQGSSSA
jgi:uncharacterized membrane protein